MTLRNVAERLASHGLGNVHWMPQRFFCDDLDETWPLYTHHVYIHHMQQGIVEALRGRVSDQVLSHVYAYLGGTTKEAGNSRHKTGAAGHLSELSPAVVELVRRFYAVDYQMFERFGAPLA